MSKMSQAPKLYGIEHCVYIAVVVVLFAAILLVNHYFIKTEKQRKIFTKCFAAIVFIAVAINRYSLYSDSFDDLLPGSYCGLTSIVLSLCVLFGKPNIKAYHFLWYMGFFGGLVVTFYSDFIGQADSFFYLATISGMAHHSLLFLLGTVMLCTKWFVPDLKKWWCFPVGLGCYTLYGLLCCLLFDWGNAMCIYDPLLPDTPLYWWFNIILGTALVTVALAIMEGIKKHKLKKTNGETFAK